MGRCWPTLGWWWDANAVLVVCDNPHHDLEPILGEDEDEALSTFDDMVAIVSLHGEVLGGDTIGGLQSRSKVKEAVDPICDEETKEGRVVAVVEVEAQKNLGAEMRRRQRVQAMEVRGRDDDIRGRQRRISMS